MRCLAGYPQRVSRGAFQTIEGSLEAWRRVHVSRRELGSHWQRKHGITWLKTGLVVRGIEEYKKVPCPLLLLCTSYLSASYFLLYSATTGVYLSPLTPSHCKSTPATAIFSHEITPRLNQTYITTSLPLANKIHSSILGQPPTFSPPSPCASPIRDQNGPSRSNFRMTETRGTVRYS